MIEKREEALKKRKEMIEQRESKAQIVTLQKTLDKPLHRGNLSISAEANFTIMDLRDELILPREIMRTVV
jgi:hypothetical protein